MTSDFIIRQRTCVCPFFFPLLFLCFFISMFSWLIHMTRSFLFFFQPTLFLESVLFSFFLYHFCISLFLHSCVPLIATTGFECSFLRVLFYFVILSFVVTFLSSLFYLFILFPSLSLVCFFSLYVIPTQIAKVL